MKEKTIKIKKEDIKVGNKVICLSNNKPYVITEANCRMKYNGDWHDCVIYTPLYDNPYKCFVRPIEDFAQNFMLDSAEEKEEKYSNLESTGKNLKPFDLQKAKAGKPICTRDGRKAVFLTTLQNKRFPVVAVVNCGQEEEVYQYDINGIYDENDEALDLMMLSEKKEGWVNIYRDIDNNIPYTENDNIYSSRDKAKESAKMLNMKTYIDTIKVEWEE